ncbi:MAG: tetratricopeptide repeat protein [Chitinispirillaceae bacterium]|nr:tetratricopeptide repeat protein [Chitinispirillaceae bacterium]
MKTVYMAASAVLSAMLLNSCSYVNVLRTQEIYAVRDSLVFRIDSLRIEFSRAQKTQDEMLRLIRADQQVRFSELERKIAEVGSGISESQYRLSKIDEKTVNFQKKIEAKLVSDSLVSSSKDMEIEKLFQIATADFNAGRFDIAISGFRDLSVRFAGSPQGQESGYWIGECAFAQKAYADAESSLLLYVKLNPSGKKLCSALYKLGLCFEKQEKVKSKEMVWKKLVEQCPDSNEAQLVKNQTAQ